MVIKAQELSSSGQNPNTQQAKPKTFVFMGLPRKLLVNTPNNKMKRFTGRAEKPYRKGQEQEAMLFCCGLFCGARDWTQDFVYVFYHQGPLLTFILK